MATRDDFTAEEWALVRDAPQLVALAVATAAPSRVLGTAKEVFAGQRAVRAGAASANGLVRAVCAPDAVEEATESLLSRLPDLARAEREVAKEHATSLAVDAARDAVAIVRRKAAADLEPYRQLLRDVAAHVAAASKEGGFLGLGGERVSAAERSVLERLEAAIA